MSSYITTKTGLRIGCMAPKSPPPHHDRDALRLQDALINKRNTSNAIDWVVVAVCISAALTAWVLVLP
jgi:hypothetical protein